MLIVVVVAVLAAAGATLALRDEDSADELAGVPDGAPTIDEMATSIGSPVMELLHRGHVPGRSGELLLVGKPNFFINRVDLSDYARFGTNDPVLNTSHPNPWGYLTRVPIVLYGPGLIRSGLEITDEIDISALAPTYARLIGMSDFAGASPVLDKALTGKGDPPRLIFTVVIDGGGWNTLQEHPTSWPSIAALMRRGTTYVNATIGSAPAVTGALHATFGTGAYPKDHGMPGNVMRWPDGEVGDVFREDADPRYLEVPTISELWDEANDNRPIVGTISYEGWHLGMIGHGAQRAAGDRDIAAIWETGDTGESAEGWWINEDFYELPSYLEKTEFRKLEGYERQLDARDGLKDGTWFSHTLEELQDRIIRPGSPAFARFTGDAVIDVIRNEDLGRDKLTDFFWVEMKAPDFAGHSWNVVRPEQADVLAETDAQIARYKAELDRRVGEGNYVMAVSADHGQQPLPEASGGWRINLEEIERDITERFGQVVDQGTPSDFFLDTRALSANDFEVGDVARYLGTYTVADSIPPGAPGTDHVPGAMMDDRVFAGVFPGDYLAALTQEEIEALGSGEYPEGQLSIEAAN